MANERDQIDSDRSEQFVRLTTEHQRRIYLYILSQLPGRADADDVLQETNVVLWRKFDQFSPDTDFRAWACRIAHYEVLKFRERRGRDAICFTDVVVETLASMALERADELDVRQQALPYCLDKLHERDRDLIRRRYTPDATTKAVAKQVGRSTDAIYKALRRIHQSLSKCIDKVLAREGTCWTNISTHMKSCVS